MVSCISNDVFRNRLNIWWVRLMVVLVMIPVVVVAIRAPGILQIYLITDLLSAAVIPVLFLGLSERVFWFVRGFLRRKRERERASKHVICYAVSPANYVIQIFPDFESVSSLASV